LVQLLGAGQLRPSLRISLPEQPRFSHKVWYKIPEGIRYDGTICFEFEYLEVKPGNQVDTLSETIQFRDLFRKHDFE